MINYPCPIRLVSMQKLNLQDCNWISKISQNDRDKALSEWQWLIWFNSDFIFCLLNATFSNISAISWRPVLVVEEVRVPGENHRQWANSYSEMKIQPVENILKASCLLILFLTSVAYFSIKLYIICHSMVHRSQYWLPVFIIMTC